jgi:hypothetical protein
VDRNSVLWTLTLFFGASIAFAAIRRATNGHGIALTLGLELVALALMIGAVVLVVRRRG